MAIESVNNLYGNLSLDYKTDREIRHQRVSRGLARISESLFIMRELALETIEQMKEPSHCLDIELARQGRFLVIDNPRRPDIKVSRKMKYWQNDEAYSTGRLCKSHVALADNGHIYIKEYKLSIYKRELEYSDLLGAVAHDIDPHMDQGIIEWLSSIQKSI